MFSRAFWVILVKLLGIVQLKSPEADLDRTVNALCLPDKGLTFPGDRGHARLSMSDKSRSQSVLNDEDKYNPAYVKEKRSLTLVTALQINPKISQARIHSSLSS